MTSKKNKNKKVQCDECGYVWKKMKKIKPKYQSIEFNNRQVILHYFVCPRCKRVYKIFIEGPRYKSFVNKLNKAKVKLIKANNEDEANILRQDVLNCQKKLEEYIAHYDKMFSGTFTVNVNGVIEYRP